ncbi:MAG: hypothetical protein H6581_16590 [Bacteroidia bacterium]|nr:hypothetical protein [Bacteroidia bacterium]
MPISIDNVNYLIKLDAPFSDAQAKALAAWITNSIILKKDQTLDVQKTGANLESLFLSKIIGNKYNKADALAAMKLFRHYLKPVPTYLDYYLTGMGHFIEMALYPWATASSSGNSKLSIGNLAGLKVDKDLKILTQGSEDPKKIYHSSNALFKLFIKIREIALKRLDGITIRPRLCLVDGSIANNDGFYVAESMKTYKELYQFLAGNQAVINAILKKEKLAANFEVTLVRKLESGLRASEAAFDVNRRRNLLASELTGKEKEFRFAYEFGCGYGQEIATYLSEATEMAMEMVDPDEWNEFTNQTSRNDDRTRGIMVTFTQNILQTQTTLSGITFKNDYQDARTFFAARSQSGQKYRELYRALAGKWRPGNSTGYKMPNIELVDSIESDTEGDGYTWSLYVERMYTSNTTKGENNFSQAQTKMKNARNLRGYVGEVIQNNKAYPVCRAIMNFSFSIQESHARYAETWKNAGNSNDANKRHYYTLFFARKLMHEMIHAALNFEDYRYIFRNSIHPNDVRKSQYLEQPMEGNNNFYYHEESVVGSHALAAQEIEAMTNVTDPRVEISDRRIRNFTFTNSEKAGMAFNVETEVTNIMLLYFIRLYRDSGRKAKMAYYLNDWKNIMRETYLSQYEPNPLGTFPYFQSAIIFQNFLIALFALYDLPNPFEPLPPLSPILVRDDSIPDYSDEDLDDLNWDVQDVDSDDDVPKFIRDI